MIQDLDPELCYAFYAGPGGKLALTHTDMYETYTSKPK